MNLFSFSKTSRKISHRKTLEQKDKDLARKKFWERAKENPQLEDQFISKMLGFEIKTPNPIEQHRQEIATKVVKLALEKIENNPELTERFVNTQVEKIVGETPIGFEGEGYQGSAISQALTEIKELDELREELGAGGKGNLLGGLVDSETIKKVIDLIISLKTTGVVTQEPIYIVQVNGQPTKVTESQYRQLEQAGKLTPIATLEMPKEQPEGEKPEEKLPGEISPEPELPAFLSTIALEEYSWMLDLTSLDFVIQLQSDLESELPYAQFLWDFLSKTDCDTIVGYVEPYKDNSQVGSYVEKLLSKEGKIWVEEVINLVKEKTIE